MPEHVVGVVGVVGVAGEDLLGTTPGPGARRVAALVEEIGQKRLGSPATFVLM